MKDGGKQCAARERAGIRDSMLLVAVTVWQPQIETGLVGANEDAVVKRDCGLHSSESPQLLLFLRGEFCEMKAEIWPPHTSFFNSEELRISTKVSTTDVLARKPFLNRTEKMALAGFVCADNRRNISRQGYSHEGEPATVDFFPGIRACVGMMLPQEVIVE